MKFAIAIFAASLALFSAAPSEAATNDRFASLLVLSGWTATSTVDPAGSQTLDGDPMAPASVPNSQISLWWAYTVPASGEVSITVSSATIPTESPGKVSLLLYGQIPAPDKTKTATSNFFALTNASNTTRTPRALLGIDGRFKATAGTTYYIEVIVNSLNYGTPITVSASTAIGQSGWYWQDAAHSGWGVAIENRGGNIYAGFFLYNADGTPIWYVANGALVNGTHFSAALQQYRGGQSILSAQQPGEGGQYVSSPGTVTIDWTGGATATMTWPGGTISIQRFIFDPGAGWMNTFEPNNYHDTGWYWLIQDGGGRGLFGEAQGSSEFWVAFHYDTAGNPTWHVTTINGLQTQGPGFASFAGNNLAAPMVAYAGGQTLTGVWKQATMTGILIQTNFTSSYPYIFDNYSSQLPMFSTLGANVYAGPSTEIAYPDLVLAGITEPAGATLQGSGGLNTTVTGPNVSEYQNLCGGVCVWQRFQF